MLITEPRPLLRKLNTTCTRAFEAAAAACVASRHYEVTVEHLLSALLEDREGDVVVLLDHYRVDTAKLRAALSRYLGDLRSGNPGKPVFSPTLLELVEDAWTYASVELGDTQLRSGALLVRLALAGARYTTIDLSPLDALPKSDLKRDLPNVALESVETGAARTSDGEPKGAVPAKGDSALAKYTTDLTERARSGQLDPVYGREAEVRQLVDILVRRRKNNPMIVGEAGVGKTALVEGFALRIAEGTVPDALKQVQLLTLDLAALQAGASMKGEFENRLRGVIAEVKASPRPIVLFIDEAHTLIGAGGQGSGDAANLLKPALARGELRTIGATTYAEFKRYIEKDPALERRFQPVKVDEPSIDQAILMLRGVASRFEQAHGVIIHDAAVEDAVKLSARYVSGRQLPDKAVDLLDTAAARVRVLRAAEPAVLEDTRVALAALDRALAAWEHDTNAGLAIDDAAVAAAKTKREEHAKRAAELEARLADQRALVARIDELRSAARADASKRGELSAELERLRAIPPAERLASADVDAAMIASVVADFTGIPVGKMVKDDVEAVLHMADRLKARVRGQDAALEILARELQSAKAGMKPASAPLGVFLLVGPSGVGKTETAISIAELLFGGERFMVTINMSEFQERHTVSRLVGSPPGYVGYGEGGVLTEAVRHRPYSVVLLDEVEKADKEVLNIFYQVFDKGMLADGEGRVIDFKNTVVIMTSNLATDLLTEAAHPERTVPPVSELIDLVKPTLTTHFKPALLARMTVVPYIPIRRDALAAIAKMKLDLVAKRAKEAQGTTLVIDDAVVQAVADRCHEVDSGARNVDHILRGTILPLLSTTILHAIADGTSLERMRLAVGEGGSFVCAPEAAPA